MSLIDDNYTKNNKDFFMLRNRNRLHFYLHRLSERKAFLAVKYIIKYEKEYILTRHNEMIQELKAMLQGNDENIVSH
jgi:hypothetical protein